MSMREIDVAEYLCYLLFNNGTFFIVCPMQDEFVPYISKSFEKMQWNYVRDI